jgi:hypothetical protein
LFWFQKWPLEERKRKACLVEGEEVVLTADGHVGCQVGPALSVLLHGLAKALLAALRPDSLKMSSATFQVEIHRNKRRFIFPRLVSVSTNFSVSSRGFSARLSFYQPAVKK